MPDVPQEVRRPQGPRQVPQLALKLQAVVSLKSTYFLFKHRVNQFFMPSDQFHFYVPSGASLAQVFFFWRMCSGHG